MEPRKYVAGELFRKPDENSGKVLKKFQKIVEDKYHIRFKDFWEFHKWSVNHLTEFWSEMWDFSGIIASQKYEKVIDLNTPFENSPEWFQGAKLNVAENIMRYRDEKIAMIITGEDKENEKVTFAEMYEEVRLYAAAFRKFGIKKGDVVVGYLSNRKEAFYAMLATTSIGAIWSSALPLLGAEAVMNRFQQVFPKILLTIDRIPNGGQDIEMLNNVNVIAEGMPSLQKVLIVASKEESKSKDIKHIKNSCFLHEFLEIGKEKDGSVPPLIFEQVSFSHPAFINFTSGTTGKPKALIHGCGGLLNIFRDFSMHLDSPRESVWLSFSPPGWVSWLSICFLHFLGMTLVVFEGVPFYLSPTYLWDLVDEFKISHLYIPTSVVDELEKRGYVPSNKHSLSSLENFICGGSVLKPQIYAFVNNKVKKGCFFSTNYACTEFMGSSITIERSLPLYVAEINAAGFGVDVRTVDDKGREVIGELGELLFVKPMPNIPLGFWGDSDGSAYKEKYFSKYPGKFAIGDYAIQNPATKGLTICCRSDETLKQRGCRFGSSEIYNVVDQFPDVRDSICVSHYGENMDERAVLFLKMREGYCFNEQLVGAIRTAITRELTKRHVPDVILEIQDIPYNMNGKKMEIIVKKIINNMSYSGDTIKNPESLKNFIDIPELKVF